MCCAARGNYHLGAALADGARNQAASGAADNGLPSSRRALLSAAPSGHGTSAGSVEHDISNGRLLRIAETNWEQHVHQLGIRRNLQALGDSNIPDEPSHAEDWQMAIEGLRLAREASNQASTAAQLIGKQALLGVKYLKVANLQICITHYQWALQLEIGREEAYTSPRLVVPHGWGLIGQGCHCAASPAGVC